jgi:gamma-glutamylcyclotransferase (GGCT)/AIG2-like uncharacterized protein YtfP
MTQMYYFAYGMNTNLGSMQQRTPTSVSMGRAQLNDFEFRFAYHADVVPKPGKMVEGVLWSIDQDGLRALDTLEGYPNYYDRIRVTVTCQSKEYSAWVYVMTPGQDLGMPSNHYKDHLLEGYTQHRIPINQILEGLHQARYYEVDKANKLAYN